MQLIAVMLYQESVSKGWHSPHQQNIYKDCPRLLPGSMFMAIDNPVRVSHVGMVPQQEVGVGRVSFLSFQLHI